MKSQATPSLQSSSAAGRPLGVTLFKHIVRSLAITTGLVLLGLAFLILTKNLLGYADLVVNRGLDLREVGAIALYQLLPILCQTLPFAVLIGALVVLGRQKRDRETLAIEAAGIAPLRIAPPVLVFAAAASTFALALSIEVAPRALAELSAAFEGIARENPGVTLRAGQVHEFGERQLLAREVSSRGDRLRGVLLWTPEIGETVFAERGEFRAGDRGTAALTLFEGVILGSPHTTLQRASFRRLDTELYRTGALRPELRADATEAASLAALRAQRADGNSTTEERRLAQAEIQRRYALPTACVVFGWLALSLALRGVHFTSSSGALLGLLGTMIYYALVQLGNLLLSVPSIPVAASIWLPNVLTAMLGGGLLWFRPRESYGFSSAISLRSLARPPQRRSLSRPSRGLILESYVAASFVRLALLCLAGLFIAYLIVDVLERLNWLAEHQARPIEALRYYGARAPLLASRVVPMGLLVGASLTVSALSVHHELMAMQSLGIRALRALAPILLITACVVPLDLFLEDWVVPRANALADRIKVEEIRDEGSMSDGAVEMWYRIEDQLIRAARVGFRRGQLERLTVYELDEHGFPTSRIDAHSATREEPGLWRLTGASRVEISETGVVTAEAPERIQIAEASSAVDPAHMSSFALIGEIRAARRDGFDTTRWEMDLHRRLAAPAACWLLPAIAVAAALRRRTLQRTAPSLLLSGALGIGYVLIVDLVASLGYGGRLGPALAGWSPPLLLALATPWLLMRGQR